MRILRADVFACGGAVRGARGATQSWATRHGLLLRVETGDGLVGQGEASPLPGYSPDTLEEARARLSAIPWATLPDAEAGEPATAYLARIERASPGLSGSARFALETALLDVQGQRLGRPLWALLSEDGPGSGPVPLSVLIGGADDPASLVAARSAVDQGVQTVKLKIAGPTLARQMDVLAGVRAIIGGRALRLDANRTLAPSSAGEEFERLSRVSPEFIEEPVPSEALSDLAEPAVPVALDESLQRDGAWDDLSPHLARIRCVAVVLKPMALGGISACLRLAASARSMGIDVTVSHLFDGPVALAACAHLALAVASRTRASGLDLHGGLAAWPEVRVPQVGPATLVATDLPGLGIAAVPAPP
jgi:o-succinylbenzoate synthase